jgi:hypothetical protein
MVGNEYDFDCSLKKILPYFTPACNFINSNNFQNSGLLAARPPTVAHEPDNKRCVMCDGAGVVQYYNKKYLVCNLYLFLS